MLGDLSFTLLPASDEQPVRFFDVTPPTGGNWRSGMDTCPATEFFFERAVPKLLALELGRVGLSIADKGVRRLTATCAIREEEIVGPLTALLFFRGL